jgi:hypothetical protein
VAPVKITTLQVTEEAFDEQLQPLRAHVSLSMQVLAFSDLSPSDPSYSTYMTYQANKESAASSGYAAGDTSSITGVRS